jgi:hypothetical protein
MRYAPGMRLCVIRNFNPDRCIATEEIGEVLRVTPLPDNKVGISIRLLKAKKPVPT